MSHNKFLSLGLLPVFGLMLLSPSSVMHSKASRGLATESDFSDIHEQKQKLHKQALMGHLDLPIIEGEEPKKDFPNYSKISNRFQSEHKHVPNNQLNRASYLEKLEGFTSAISKEKDSLELKDEASIKAAEKRIESLAQAISGAEKDLADLEARDLIKKDDEKKPEAILSETKSKLEDLLNKIGSAKEALHKKEVAVVEEKKENVEVIETVISEKKDSKETKKEKDESELLCELRDQNKAMNDSIQKLIADQTSIMSQMMAMMQTLVASQQNQQQLLQSQSLYQYYPQFPQGNWMYSPYGSQLSMSPFGLPYQPQNNYAQPPVYNIPQGTPSAAVSGAWSLKPDQNLQFQDPRMVPMGPVMTGQLGGPQIDLGVSGFNMNPISAPVQMNLSMI